MKYTTFNAHDLATKNKLQKAVQAYLNGIDRILIENDEALEDIKVKIIANIVFLNNEYPKCKGIRASWFETDKNDWLLSGVGFSNFHIYHIKKDYLKL